jgi:hypothetical protein
MLHQSTRVDFGTLTVQLRLSPDLALTRYTRVQPWLIFTRLQHPLRASSSRTHFETTHLTYLPFTRRRTYRPVIFPFFTAILSHGKEFRYGWRYCAFLFLCFSCGAIGGGPRRLASHLSIMLAIIHPALYHRHFMLHPFFLFPSSIPSTQCILFSALFACATLRSRGLGLQ